MSLAYEKYNSLCEKSIELFCIGSYAVRLEGGNFFEVEDFWQYSHFFSVSEKAAPFNICTNWGGNFIFRMLSLSTFLN